MFLSTLDKIIPYTYFLLLMIFLVSFSFLISFQLVDIFRIELIFYKLNKINPDHHSADQLFTLLKILVNKKLWFTSINLMESRKDISSIKMYQYFNAIGYIYDKMEKYNLSSLYYLKAIDIKKDYIIALQNLAKIYEKTNSTLAISLYKTILKYDSINKRANKYIQLKNKV